MRHALRLVALLAASALVPVALAAAPQKSKSRKIIDREAGVAYFVTLPHGEVLHGEKLQAKLAALPTLWLPPQTKATSAVFIPGSATPYVVISKRVLEGGVSRELVDALSVSPERTSVTTGLGRFLFYPDHLQGLADGSASAHPQAKVLVQLVKDRAAYVTFFYQKPEELSAFVNLHKSLYVGRKSKLDAANLPRHPTGTGMSLAGILTMLAALSAIGLGAFVFYRRERSSPSAAQVAGEGPQIALETPVELRDHPVV